MNDFDLKGKTAVVTGGANGIGAAIAERFVASGARVALWDLEPDALDKRAAAIPEASRIAVKVDVSDWDSVSAAASETESRLAPVDILVNSAGIAGPSATLVDYDLAAWRRVQAINTDGTFHCCKALLPGMAERDYGRVVNVASIAGKEGNPTASAYSASKAAVIAMTKSLGKEMAGKNIAVNCITPATANTRILEQVSQEFIDYMLSKIPRGRFVTVEEIASMVTWLCSAENSFTTGAAFDLSGGRATY
jgi:NAD(P)-dependent dehydrogenase (short-subunit alcohol dehydrogenase family)